MTNLVAVLVWVLSVLPKSLYAVPSTIDGNKIIVDGKPVFLKGVNWNPVAAGKSQLTGGVDFRGYVEVDSALMQAAGINALRTYVPITDTEVLDILWSRGIYVLNTVYASGVAEINSVVAPITEVKDHPAILMWVVGNEWNYNGLYTGLPFEESRERVRQAVQCIKDADPSRPVATVHGELPSSETLEALGGVDVWGINKYDGDSFGDLFQSWAEMSELPMFLGEYGADAYNTDEDKEDEQAQADATKRLTAEIVEASSVDKDGVCIGGVIFELADEWWKDDSGNPGEHDIGGVSPGGGPYPDGTFNEEWWGLLHHDGTAREAFKAYASIQVPGGPDLDLAKADGVAHASPPPREKACGAHRACRGHTGDCCPARNGSMATCCGGTSAQPPEKEAKEDSSTTGRRPKDHEEGEPEGDSKVEHEYTQQRGQFANGHFDPDLPGCKGVDECQFMTRQEAERWCDGEPKCTIVLLHPFDENCAGGLGCYTPRYGTVSANDLFERSGGKSWPKGAAVAAADDAPAETGSSTSRPPMGSAAEALDDAEAEEAKEQSEDSPAPAAEDSASEDGADDGGEYQFLGFDTPSGARRACSKAGRLAMPKTDRHKKGVLQAIRRAIAAGEMGESWPRNAVWLAGRWNSSAKKWEWDDSTDIPELVGQKAATLDSSAGRPWLCVSADGQARAWDGGKLGVLCQLGDPEGKTRTRELALPPKSDVAWVRAPPATDCDEACAGAGMACAEGRWPGSADELARVVVPGAGAPPCATIQSGGHRYDPSASGRHCGWQGPDDRPAWLGRRCGAPAPRGSRRFCPCQGGAAAGFLAGHPIWT